MKLLTRQKTPADELKNAAIAALLNVLEEQQSASRDKRVLTGGRAVTIGAAIYTAGFAAFKGRRFLREQLSPKSEDERAEDELDEQATEAHEERDEPEAEQDEYGEPDEESSSKTPPRPPERKPRRRAAQKKGAQPSLELPRQRWRRLPVGRK